MQLKRGSAAPQGVTVEVSAGARPSEVLGAVLKGAEPKKQSLWDSKERPIQLAFLFVLIFGIVVYFREEIWAFSNDVSKHPIMAYTEQLQIRKWVGTQWLFASGGDAKISAEVVEALETTTSSSQDPAAAPTTQQPTPEVTSAPANNTTAEAKPATRRLLAASSTRWHRRLRQNRHALLAA